MFAALLAACAMPGPPPPEAARSEADVPAEIVEAGIVAEGNRMRAREGARALVPDDRLTRAARGHAAELQRRRILDHLSEDSDRRTLEQRIALEGVDGYTRIGENLGSILNPLIDPSREIVRLWLGSEGHRANLLEAAFDRTGVGAMRADDGTWFVVQVYGAGIRAP